MKAIELEKAYNPKDFEDRIYKDWESKGCFKPASDPVSPIHAEWECKCADCKDGKKKAGPLFSGDSAAQRNGRFAHGPRP